MTDDDVEVIEKTTGYKGYCQVDVYKLRHRVFDQGWSDVMTREVVERGHAVGVLPYDPVRNELVLIEQFRIGAYAARDYPTWQIECVAGMIEHGQTPEQVARREIVEEAGVEAIDIIPMVRYLSSPGAISESLQLFAARVDATGVGGIHGLAHEHEFMRVFTMPPEEAFAQLERGDITNGMTIIALQWLQLHLDKLRADWRS